MLVVLRVVIKSGRVGNVLNVERSCITHNQSARINRNMDAIGLNGAGFVFIMMVDGDQDSGWIVMCLSAFSLFLFCFCLIPFFAPHQAGIARCLYRIN